VNFQSRFLGIGSDWLKQLKQRFSKQRSRQQAACKAAQGTLESLEQRTLLSATGSLIGNDLLIVTDANESVSVAQDLMNPSFVEVLINGVPINSLPTIQLNDIHSLVILAGELENTVDVSQVNATAFLNLTSIRIETGDGDDTVILSPDFASIVFTGDGNDTVTSADAADTINGENGNDSIIGGLGDDVIDAGDGDDIVTGDGGADDIQAGDGDDTINGGEGSDTILGGDGADVLSGDAGADSIIGDAGDDVLFGGADDDTLLGGGGDDTITGDDGADIISGASGADVLNGSADADIIFGKAGRDSIFGGAANDFIKGGSGDDSLVGNGENDTIYGGVGNDELFGDSNNPISPEFGNDLLFGESGRDTLIGSRGSDQLDGGDGNDLLRSALDFGSAIAIQPLPPTPTPVPPGTPVTTVSGILNGATDSGMGVTVGPINTMAIGTGDASLSLTVDAVGSFGTNSPAFSGATFDPIGILGAATTTFDSGVYFRNGNTGARARLDTVAGGISGIRATTTESNSTFTVGTLLFALTQTVEPITDSMGQTGSLLTQTYRIRNLSFATANFELVRYYDGDLNYVTPGATDGGGHLVANSGEDVMFITDEAGPPGLPTTFVGVTGLGGLNVGAGRFQSDTPAFLAAIQAGTALNDAVTNDVDGDEFVDAGLDLDVAVALQNNFRLLPLRTVSYTTHTIFGSGSPTVAATNMVPMAVDDFVLLPAGAQGGTVTIDVTANDSDADGALDVTSVMVVSQPVNGTVVNLGNGLIEYTSDPGFVGMDLFQYSIADNQGSVSTATVRVAVLDIDDNGDTLLGGSGSDTIIGENGDDFVDGGNDGDIINTGGGDDFAYGGGGNDSILGGAGRDTLVGNGGSDTLNGGDSDDTILWRGKKDFRVKVESSNGQDFVVLQGDSSANNITLQTVGNDLTATEGNAQITIDATIQNITINLAGGDDTLTMLDMSGVNLNAIVINGDIGNDTIDLGNAIRNGTLLILADGGAGDDILIGSSGPESLIGGAGDDVVNAGAGDDRIDGGIGNDVLNGGPGNDTFVGGDGNDQLNGGDGDDLLIGGIGNDSINGDAGNDVLQGNFGDDFLNGSTGNDSISGGLGRDVVVGGAGRDTLNGGHNDDTILGNSGNDLIIASNGNDFVNGGNGNDTINGGDGDDTLIGGAGNDLMAGVDGADFMSGDAGDDTMVGGDGNDTVLGGSQNDVTLGGEGNDAVNGGGGVDTGAQGDGDDVALQRIENVDEAFVLSDELLDALNGQS
jgi:Ca2+-binding RTX toxin-like protein